MNAFMLNNFMVAFLTLIDAQRLMIVGLRKGQVE